MDKPIRVTLRTAGEAVRRREQFKGSNIYGVAHLTGLYVVYSYGLHFPVYVWDRWAGWIRNTDKYSPSTSRHQIACHPGVTDMLEMNTGQMRDLIAAGSWAEYVARRMEKPAGWGEVCRA